MNIRNWLRTRRALVADLDRQRDMLAEADEELRFWVNEMNVGWDRADKEINQAKRERDDALRKLATKRQQLATVRTELEKLREEIAQLEQGERPFGMARPLDRPMPWQVADAIAQDVEAKRQADV